MTDSDSNFANYNEIDGIVWMKRNNRLQFTSGTLESNKSKMDADKNVSLRKDDTNEDDDSEQSSYDSNSDQDIALNDEDVWDDSLLIKMYEASQKQINDELTKRFTATTADSSNVEPVINNNSSSVASSTGAVIGKKSKHKTNHQKTKTNLDSKPVLSKPINWKEGDYCQCTYLEDNVDYEAKIISIKPAEQTCVVRYIGYENEEVRSLSDLKSSEGEKVRKLQIEMSIQDGYGKQNGTIEEQQAIHMQAPGAEFMLPKQLSQLGPGPSTNRIIPPPPPFALLGDNVASSNNPNLLLEDDDDVLASMLMSWYMSGYNTGYYQARKYMKNNIR